MQLEPASLPAPLDIMGGRNIWHGALRCDCARSIIETECPMLMDVTPELTAEPLQGDDFKVEYYDDGYPKIPKCLDRTPTPFAGIGDLNAA
jgi:hypothetical protein